jgi:hypothetical protein
MTPTPGANNSGAGWLLHAGNTVCGKHVDLGAPLLSGGGRSYRIQVCGPWGVPRSKIKACLIRVIEVVQLWFFFIFLVKSYQTLSHKMESTRSFRGESISYIIEVKKKIAHLTS